MDGRCDDGPQLLIFFAYVDLKMHWRPRILIYSKYTTVLNIYLLRGGVGVTLPCPLSSLPFPSILVYFNWNRRNNYFFLYIHFLLWQAPSISLCFHSILLPPSAGRERTKEMVLWCGGDAVCSVVIPSNILKMVLLWCGYLEITIDTVVLHNTRRRRTMNLLK